MRNHAQALPRVSAVPGGALAAVFAAAMATGCVPIAGTLDVRAPVKLSVTELFEDADSCAIADFDADCERYETVKETVLSSGRYQAALDMSDRSALTLSLTEQNNVRQEIRFSRPRNLRLPEKEGRFTLLEQQLGQPVDVRGDVTTSSTHSDLRREYEFCSYEVERWICAGPHHGANAAGEARAYLASHGNAGHRRSTVQDLGHGHRKPGVQAHKQRHGHGPSCGWRTRRVQGSRQVEFFLEYETRTVALDRLRPGTRDRVAVFEGAQTQTHKHYQRVGACF